MAVELSNAFFCRLGLPRAGERRSSAEAALRGGARSAVFHGERGCKNLLRMAWGEVLALLGWISATFRRSLLEYLYDGDAGWGCWRQAGDAGDAGW